MSVIPCTKNPIVEYIKYVIQQYELDPVLYSNSLENAFLAFAYHTFTSDINTEYCCPSCGTYGLTFSAKLSEPFITSQESNNYGCCINYNTTDIKADGLVQMFTRVEEYDYVNCCNDFQSCSTDMLNLIQSKLMTPINKTIITGSIGVFEISLLSGKTVTCELYQYLTTSSLSNEYLYDILNFIYVHGLTVSCKIGEGGFETAVSTIN